MLAVRGHVWIRIHKHNYEATCLAYNIRFVCQGCASHLFLQMVRIKVAEVTHKEQALRESDNRKKEGLCLIFVSVLLPVYCSCFGLDQMGFAATSRPFQLEKKKMFS